MRRQLGISQCFDDEHAAAFAPGFESVRTINTGPVDPSTNVGDGLNGHGQAPGTGVTHMHLQRKMRGANIFGQTRVIFEADVVNESK